MENDWIDQLPVLRVAANIRALGLLSLKRWLWFGTMLFWLLALFWQPVVSPSASSAWTQKPVLAYLVLTARPLEDLSSAQILTEEQVRLVQDAARREQAQLLRLEQTTLPVIQHAGLTLVQKRVLVRLVGYNERIARLIRDSRAATCVQLGLPACLRLAAWTEKQWAAERAIHGAPARQSGPRTFRIFATHYDSSGKPLVALPDACLKLANGGSHSCDSKGYQAGQGYTVFIGYKGKTAAFLVGEAGPWNVDDNYWASLYDPQPRRMFADLAVGLPEAQAAFFNGYNGGQDQYGRTVTAPFGIDLGDGVGSQIGLPPGANDWIDVTFMWTEGWGQTAPGTSSGGAVAPLETAAPAEDGSVVHEVKAGQALWSIAAAYQLNLPDLLALNGLTEKSIIRPGDRLVIVPAGLTITLTSEPAAARPTLTPPARPTPTPQPASSTPLEPSLTLPAASQTLPPSAGEGIDPLLLAILALVLLGAGLLLAGLRRR